MQVPRSRFLELFDDPATMPRWQKDVVSVEMTETVRWVAHHVFEFSGVMTLVGVLFGRAFPKASHRDLEAFKAFAESEPRA